MNGRSDVDEVGDIVEQEFTEFFAQDRVVVSDVVGAESGEKINVFAAFVIPQARARCANENASITKSAKQLDERGIDVLGVFFDRGMIRNGERHA